MVLKVRKRRKLTKKIEKHVILFWGRISKKSLKIAFFNKEQFWFGSCFQMETC